MEKRMETTIMGYIGTTVRIYSFIASSPKASLNPHNSDVLLLSSVCPIDFPDRARLP